MTDEESHYLEDSTAEQAEGEDAGKPKRTRTARPYPACSFLEALPIADAIHEQGAGQKVRRVTLFEKMGRSSESGPSRQLVTNSGAYGLTIGSYKAEWLELSSAGRLASDPEGSERARLAARLQLAITKIEPFNTLYTRFSNNRLPSTAVMRDALVEGGMAVDLAEGAVETFLANARDLGLVKTMAGAERMLTFEHLLDEASTGAEEAETGSSLEAVANRPKLRAVETLGSPASRIVEEATDLSDVCFLVTPIGDEGSEARQHADLMLGSLIQPALEALGLDLRIVRSDKISKPGMITTQVIDHLVRAPLVVADLSFGNPNVYYELALRHAARRPVVQVIRSGDHLPFDVGQFRTVSINMTDIYSLVPQLDSYRAEIARQCRAAFQENGDAQSPLSLFYPEFWKRSGHPGT